MKASYSAPSQIEGFAELKEGEQGKVQRAWDAGAVPEEDQGVGEAVAREKKAPARRKKKEEDGEEGEKPKRARAKKAKVHFHPRFLFALLIDCFCSVFRRTKMRMVMRRSRKRSVHRPRRM